jgi:hypothetical protein
MKKEERIEQVSCGANFTIARTSLGNCFSWGWMAYGVLGRGRGLTNAEPEFLYSFGDTFYGEGERNVFQVSAGSSHVVVAIKQDRNVWASTIYRQMLSSPSFLANSADVELVVEGYSEILLAHSAVLAARSSYLGGLVNQAKIEGNSIGQKRCVVEFEASAHLTPAILMNILKFIYEDSISVRSQHRVALAASSGALGLYQLQELCQRNSGTCSRPISSFDFDMQRAILEGRYFHDVCFYSQGNTISLMTQ